MEKNFRRKRKGLTLIEAIIVIVIMAIFALIAFQGGKPVINSANISVVQSDFHTIELAAKQMLFEHPEYITLKKYSGNSSGCLFLLQQQNLLNRYLPDEMQLSPEMYHDMEGLYFRSISAKTDPWAQAYKVYLTPNDTTQTYRIHVFSSGPNTVTTEADVTVDKDDLVMCIELHGGDVKSKTWGFTEDNTAGTAIKTLIP